MRKTDGFKFEKAESILKKAVLKSEELNLNVAFVT